MVLKKSTKKSKTNVFLMVFVIMIATVIAVTGVIQIDTFYDSSTGNSLTGVGSLLYNCNDNVCDNIGSKLFDLNSGSNNKITFEYPYNPSSTDSNRDYYAHYLFKQCYLPKEYVESIWGYGATLEYDYDFNKAPSCHSPIDSFSVTNSNYVNEPVVVNIQAILGADAHSAFTNAELTYVPSGYENYYSAETKITLEILNGADNVVYTESKTYEILMDTSQNVEFTWTPSSNGDYTARVTTDVTDCQCQSSFEQFSERNFVVWEERPQNECYTIINDLEATPEFAMEGEEVMVRFNKISNYADSNHVKTTIPTRATYEITDNENNIVFSSSILLNANANEMDAKEISFPWIPNFGGDFNIKVIGVGESSLCNGKTNPEDSGTLGFFVSSTPTYKIVFLVSDLETDLMLNGANIDFGNQNGATDSAGRVVFTSNSGIYNWEVSLSGYDSKTNTITITEDITIEVSLDLTEEDERISEGKGSGGMKQLKFPVLLGSSSDTFISGSTMDVGEKPEESKSISGLIFILIAEVIITLVIVLFLLVRVFKR